MTRIFTDGAELGDMSFWSTVSGAPSATVVEKRSGEYSYLSASSANTCGKGLDPISEFYFREGFRSTVLANHKMPWWYKGATQLGGLRVNNISGKIEAFTSTGTLVATGSISLSLSTWYLIEVHVKIADAPNGVIQVKVDGVLDIDFTGDTKPGTDTDIDSLVFSSGGGSSGTYFDDLALNDTSGVVDNSWCGDGKVLLLKPNAAGDVTQLTPSAGANYECVDDIPSDGDTSYVSSPTTDQYDLYNLESFTPTGVTISRVWAEARARKSQADTRKLKFILKTHAAEYDGSGDLDLMTSHTQVNGTEQLVNPNTSAAWIISELDDLQVGVKVR